MKGKIKTNLLMLTGGFIGALFSVALSAADMPSTQVDFNANVIAGTCELSAEKPQFPTVILEQKPESMKPLAIANLVVTLTNCKGSSKNSNRQIFLSFGRSATTTGLLTDHLINFYFKLIVHRTINGAKGLGFGVYQPGTTNFVEANMINLQSHDHTDSGYSGEYMLYSAGELASKGGQFSDLTGSRFTFPVGIMCQNVANDSQCDKVTAGQLKAGLMVKFNFR
ncbi:hypothetical protein [Serratia microhaemolytica]|uniref:hypothetical protein n=1 Tax=Serratia microhaemolytica TaxID=2675110 RepID=UPI000FDCDDF9|nr:hypothetical protein [Serratia microhaemolytica]